MADFDPVTIASQLATAYIQPSQDRLTANSRSAQSTSSGLTSLSTALSTFNSALAGLSGTATSSLRSVTATFSNSEAGTASATAKAAAGTYSFFVEQLATAHQIVFEDLPAIPVASGSPLVVQVGGETINVNLAEADQDNDGSLSASEIARAINQAGENAGKVTASVISTGSGSSLILSAAKTGASSEITVDASALGASAGAFDTSRELVAAQDAKVWLGAQGTGVLMEQASNTFTSISGVTATFSKANTQTTLTVAADTSGTQANVQKFIDAWNTLERALDNLTKAGDPENGTASAVFASDSSVRNLRSRLNSLLRSEHEGQTLMNLGVRANRDGTLSFDKDRFAKALEADPDALDKLFGNAGTAAPAGLLGDISQYLKTTWLKTGDGTIAQRQATVQRMQKDITARQNRLDEQYDLLYQRYLAQFSQLQAVQAQYAQTGNLFSLS